MLKFDEFIAVLDSLKQLFYLAEYVKRNECSTELWGMACSLQLRLRGTGNMSAAELMRFVFLAPEFSYKAEPLPYVDLSQTSTWGPLAVEFERILKHHRDTDSAFYEAAGFAKFWNEVENPLFVDTLFAKAAAEVKDTHPGLICAESNLSRENIKDGMYAISYYDVGDLALVFADRAAAEAFAEEFPVEPSELMSANNDGWICC